MGLTVPDKVVKFRGPRLNCSEESRPKAIGDGIFDSFFRDNFLPEVASGLISGVAVEFVGVDLNVKCGDSRSNRSRYIRTAHFVMEDERRHQRTQIIT